MFESSYKKRLNLLEFSLFWHLCLGDRFNLVDDFALGCYIHGILIGENDHPGFCFVGFMDIAVFDIIDRDIGAVFGFAVPGGQRAGFQEGLLGDKAAVGNDQNMRAGNIFYVEPTILIAPQSGGDGIVLVIVFANQNIEAF